jgi:hypothetical protein
MSGTFQHVFAFGPDGDGDGAERPEPVRPVWMQPEDELAAAVPLGAVVGRSEQGVVGLSHALVFSRGVSFSLVALARGLSRRTAQQIFHEQHTADPEDLPDGFVRVGLELADGVRVSNLGRRHPWGLKPDEEPDGPIFHHSGGGGGTGRADGVAMRNDYWLWPLPPEGPVRVSCEWPAAAIELSTVEVDGAALVAAAARVVPLWPDGARGAD